MDSSRIKFSAVYLLSGDVYGFATNDADKDDYMQMCVSGPANGTPAIPWQVYSKGQNILFANDHTKWYKG